jgi:hypothetical protein
MVVGVEVVVVEEEGLAFEAVEVVVYKRCN